MKLDLNFNKLTKLREWWKQVYNNFKIIETECSETRIIAESALTSEEAQEYMMEFINSTPEHMSAIESFTQLLAEKGGTVEALEEMFGERLRYYKCETELDADAATEAAIYICESGTVNTPDNGNGILLNFICQYWLTVNGNIYSRQSGSEWIKTDKAVNDRLDEIDESISLIQEKKSEAVFGTYVGNGNSERTINLGFTPVAVEITTSYGMQYYNSGSHPQVFGGCAVSGKPCNFNSINAIEIVSNGFKVYYDNSRVYTNNSDTTYHFIAFKNGEIMEVS